jgi:elongation factor P
MVIASALRAGLAVRLEGALYKVVEVTNHAGQGKMGGSTHVKLRNLATATMREWRFHPEDAVEEIVPERQSLQFLYKDDTLCHFMNPETFEQVDIEHAQLGRAGSFLVEEMVVPVEFVDGSPIGIVMPDVVEVRVVDTAPPVRTHGGNNVWKEARLENGLKIMVPPFIAAGEAIRVEVERGIYMERSHKK